MSTALKQLQSPLRNIIKRNRNFSTTTRSLKTHRNRSLATMPVFPRFASNTLNEFRPLLRMFDDPSFYDFSPAVESSRTLRAFSPNFDVHETDREYVLEGELPGLSDKNNVSIEFTDHNTLLVRGRIEKSYESGAPPSQQQQAQMSGAQEAEKLHKPTVEDESSQQVTKTDEQSKQVGHPATKYWVSERSVGSFQRSFSFPGEIDQDAVTAKLKDGILTVKVPKKQQRQAKRINIE